MVYNIELVIEGNKFSENEGVCWLLLDCWLGRIEGNWNGNGLIIERNWNDIIIMEIN